MTTRWYEEGSAEVYSYTRLEGDEIVIDIPRDRIRNFNSASSLGINAWVSFDKIVGDDFDTYGGYKDVYLQYWVLTHYLQFGDPALKPPLNRSMQLYAAGKDPLAAFTGAFGRTPDEMWKYVEEPLN